MENRRRLRRQDARFHLNVMNQETDESVGRLVNLTTNGMQIISEQPILTDTTYHLEVELPSLPEESVLPEGVDVTEQVQFDARAVWSRKKTNLDFWDTGMELTNVSQETVDTLYSALQDALFQY